MFPRNKLLAALGAGAVFVTLGSTGHTAAIDMSADPASIGYSTLSVDGNATVTNVKFTLNGPGTRVTAAHVEFSGDVSTQRVEVGFDNSNLTACAAGNFADGATTYDCDISGGAYATGAVSDFHVAIYEAV